MGIFQLVKKIKKNAVNIFAVMVFLTVVIGIVNADLFEEYVDDLDDDQTQWTEIGDDPYLHTTIIDEEDWGDYIQATDTLNLEHGDFSFPALPESACSINSVNLEVYIICQNNVRVGIDVWDSGSSIYASHSPACPVSDIGDYVNIPLPELTTVDEVNNMKFHTRTRGKSGASGNVDVISAELKVDYETDCNCYTFEDDYLSIPPECDYQDLGNILGEIS